MQKTPSSKLQSSDSTKHRFCLRFRWSLNSCLKHGFSVEDCFGEIWQETLEEIRLGEADEAEAYAEMLAWAKRQRAA